MNRELDNGLHQRRSATRILILIALAIAAGRIAVVTRDGVTAFLSANDRSRWATIASLVEHRTYSIDTQEAITVPNPISKKAYRPWFTIDKVQHVGSDGKLHFYSSKPPLFPTMVAGVYAVAKFVLGMTLTEQPMYMTRIMLALINLPLLALFLFATCECVNRVCRSDWAARLSVLCVCFATMMIPFSISLNNHLPAAAATAAVMWIYLLAAERLDQSRRDQADGVTPKEVSPWLWFAAGLSAAFAAANELPALSMMAFWGLLFLFLSRKSVLPFAAGIAVVAIGFFGTNWTAHQSWRPPYAHRGVGDAIGELESAATAPDQQSVDTFRQMLIDAGLETSAGETSLKPSDEPNRWVLSVGEVPYAVINTNAGSADEMRTYKLAHWDDWYEYPGTHWKPENLKSVDKGEPSRLVYFAHMTIGHHGVFSLTPIWILVPIGLVYGLGFGPSDHRRLMLAILVATCVCVAFYIARPEIDRNYGGVSVCFRWLLWFAPLWLLAIAPVIDRMADSRRLRAALKIMLALSVFSVSTALSSPWQHPWLYQYWRFLGLFGLD